MFSLNELNSEQRKAAVALKGPVLILAGAGSGKTKTVTFRIAHMVLNEGIDPNSILAVSFTNKAAGEMRERVETILGKKQASLMTLSTFHSLGVKILRSQITKLGYSKAFTIYDTGDQNSIIRQALKSFKDEKKFDRKTILSKISFLKNKGVSCDEFASSAHFDHDNPYDLATEYCYSYYQNSLKFFNAIDFDDILYLTVKLLRDNPDLRSYYSDKFRYIMIDEFQDTNPMQLELVSYLTTNHNNICVVGDDDQSIYAFRGADVTNILNFEKLYLGTKVIKLEQNYRSTKPIIDLANKVIIQNKHRKDKAMFTNTPSNHIPQLWITGDSDHEANIVAEDILKRNRSEEFELKNVAILYRSNTQTGPLEDALRMNTLNYKMIGGQKLYDKKEIKDLIAYLAIIQNPFDEISLRRILNVPNRGIGKATLDTFVNESKTRKLPLLKTMEIDPHIAPKKAGHIKNFTDLISRYRSKFKSESLPAIILQFIEEIEFNKYIEKTADSDKQASLKKNDVSHFVDAAARFEKNFKGATLKDFLEKVLLQDSQDDKNENDEKDKDEITMMTLHSSKGLEFEYIYLIGIEEEILPHKRVISEGDDINEELRLTYVGLTRAKKELVMTYARERELFGKLVPRLKSRFLLGLEDYYKEVDKTGFAHMSKTEEKTYKKNFFDSLISNIDD